MGLISKNKNRNQIKTTQNKNRYRKIKLLWGGVLGRYEVLWSCGGLFSVLLLNYAALCGGSIGFGCEIPLPVGTEICVCVRRVVDYSSLVMHGRILLYWEI